MSALARVRCALVLGPGSPHLELRLGPPDHRQLAELRPAEALELARQLYLLGHAAEDVETQSTAGVCPAEAGGEGCVLGATKPCQALDADESLSPPAMYPTIDLASFLRP
ncbi:MAG TPA: hypothetical protein VF017_15375 [Thermoanaerobaculia bacterium]|nr:hypothetical protein [Thermoanaerobaculia bacterium]